MSIVEAFTGRLGSSPSQAKGLQQWLGARKTALLEGVRLGKAFAAKWGTSDKTGLQQLFPCDCSRPSADISPAPSAAPLAPSKSEIVSTSCISAEAPVPIQDSPTRNRTVASSSGGKDGHTCIAVGFFEAINQREDEVRVSSRRTAIFPLFVEVSISLGAKPRTIQIMTENSNPTNPSPEQFCEM